MLVKVTTDVGGVSNDQKTRFFNFLACLHAVATAAAGSSPVVNPVNSTTGVKDTGLNCITVMSNTEAGGWLAGTSNNITAATAYNASASTPWYVDLYRTTDKSTYPWYRQTFGNIGTAFNGAWTSSPKLQFRQGCTTNNPTSVAAPSDTNFWNGTTSSQSTDSGMNAPGGLIRVDYASDNIYIACTANYLIIMTNFALNYFGIRTQGGWEISRTDNPPWVAFGYSYTGSSNNNGMTGSITGINQILHSWSSVITHSGTQVAAAKYGTRHDNATTNTCLLSGYVGYDQQNRTAMRNGAGNGLNIYAIVKYLNAQYSRYSSWQYNGVVLIDPPVVDPATGLNTPPSYPIVFHMQNTNSGQYGSAIGTAPGILKGMCGTPTTLATYVTASEYTINGESYVPIQFLPMNQDSSVYDLWMLRKA